MNQKQEPFWKTKTLNQMTRDEWESLCDHCGLCCLQKIEDENTGEIKLIGVGCDYLDTENCRCLVYDNRKFVNPDCVVLTPNKVKQIKWLPNTCVYRRISEGKELKWWHHLVSGDPSCVHRAGISVRLCSSGRDICAR